MSGPLGIYEIEERFDVSSWTLVKYGNGGNHALMPYSRLHVINPATGQPFCGAKHGLHFGHGHSGRCKTCYRMASRQPAESISVEGEKP